MTFIPLAILKSRSAVSGAETNTEFCLMRPAFEPFLLARLVLSCRHDGLTSFQFRATEDLSIFHYANIEHAKLGYPEGTLVEIILAGDLPLDSTRRWSVVKIDSDGNEVILGDLSRNYMGVWDFKGDMERSQDIKLNDPYQFIFIGGAPKSGTTWVERLLNIHPDMLATGENGLFGWPRIDLLGQAMVADPPPYFAFAAPKIWPYHTRAAMAYAGQAERILAQVADIARVNVVADKTSNYGVFSPFLLESLPEARYIHCVRHPLDTAVSRFFHECNLLRDSPELSLLPQDDDLRAYVLSFNSSRASPGEMFANQNLFDWALDAVLEGQIVLEIAAECKRVHIIRYEDLLNNFTTVASRLFAFCGFEVNEAFLEVAALRTNFSTFAEGRAPGVAHESHFFRKGIAGDHLNYMTPQQIYYAKKYILMRCPWYQEYFKN